MGACSVDLPTIVVPGGPMLNGRFRGGIIGSGSFNWMIKTKQTTENFSAEDLLEAEICAARSSGHCNTMGTASTMATMVEALGLTLPGMSAIPAVDSRKKVIAQLSGRRIVEMVNEDLTLSKILTRKAFENAVIVNAAVGGSTNLIIHLTAVAGRIGADKEPFAGQEKKQPNRKDVLQGRFHHDKGKLRKTGMIMQKQEPCHLSSHQKQDHDPESHENLFIAAFHVQPGR